MIKGNKRLYSESQKQYKKRLRTEKKIVKGWLLGRRIWNSGSLGTYARAEHGEIGSRAIN